MVPTGDRSIRFEGQHLPFVQQGMFDLPWQPATLGFLQAVVTRMCHMVITKHMDGRRYINVSDVRVSIVTKTSNTNVREGPGRDQVADEEDENMSDVSLV